MMRKQSGMVLVIGLIMLTALTFLSIIGMQRAGLQTRIVGNIQHKEALYKSNKNEQEYRAMSMRQKDTPIAQRIELAIVQATPNVDSNGNITSYQEISLSDTIAETNSNAMPYTYDSDYDDATPGDTIVRATIRRLPNTGGVNFAKGKEVGKYTQLRFQIDTDASFYRSANNVNEFFQNNDSNGQRAGFEDDIKIVAANNL